MNKLGIIVNNNNNRLGIVKTVVIVGLVYVCLLLVWSMCATVSVLRTGGCEGVTTLGEDLHEVVSQVPTSQVQTEDGVGQSVTYNIHFIKENIRKQSFTMLSRLYLNKYFSILFYFKIRNKFGIQSQVRRERRNP